MLEAIYTHLKEDFEKRRDAMLDTGVMPRYVPPDGIAVENVDEVIQTTNEEVAKAAENDIPKEIHAASRKANLLLAMARDNYSAQTPRLEQCRSYLLYVERALHEADPEDPRDSDGILLANIRRVDL